MLKLISILIALLPIIALHAQQVTNLQVTQEGDNVVINYDITSDKAGQTFDIKVECSTDGGKSFSILPQSLTGAIKDVSAGAGKRIVWDVLSERQELAGDQFVFQLVATVNNPTNSYSGDSGTFTDSRDGQVYKWVKIGTQVWMAENVAYLPWVNLPLEGSKTSPRYYVYDYNGINKEIAKAMPNYKTYGVLYNWPAAKVACPKGWHLPNDAEWAKLINFLGGESVGGGKLKETGTNNWAKPNTGATNETSFTALPAGGRNVSGAFDDIGYYGFWWSSTEGSDGAWDRDVGYNYSGIARNSGVEEDGFSVRCVKD